MAERIDAAMPMSVCEEIKSVERPFVMLSVQPTKKQPKDMRVIIREGLEGVEVAADPNNAVPIAVTAMTCHFVLLIGSTINPPIIYPVFSVNPITAHPRRPVQIPVRIHRRHHPREDNRKPIIHARAQ